MIPKLH